MSIWLSDQIADEYTKWNCGDRILLHAQTGRGKTTFILTRLLVYAHEHNKHILYFCNRAALKNEILNSIEEKYFDSITVLTYQQAYPLFNTVPSSADSNWSSLREKMLSATYWIMDEAHYFYSDSTFNGTASDCMKKMFKASPRHINVLITATPEYLFLLAHVYSVFESYELTFQFPSLDFIFQNPDCFCPHTYLSVDSLLALTTPPTPPKLAFSCTTLPEEEPLIKSFNHKQMRYVKLSSGAKFSLQYSKYLQAFSKIEHKIFQYSYSTTPDYSYLTPYCFRHLCELERYIISSNSSEKWLIFVSSRSEGTSLSSSLNNAGISTVFIDAHTRFKKGTPAHEQLDCIINGAEEKTPLTYQVLIATSVLDNGISIKDSTVKHIAIIADNPVTFLQMLGRRRISSGEKINLYVKTDFIRNLKSHVNRSIVERIKFILDFQLEKMRDISYYTNTPEHYQTAISAFDFFKSTYLKGQLFSAPYSSLIEPAAPTSEELDKMKSPHFRDRSFLYTSQIKPSALTFLTYHFYRYMSFFQQVNGEKTKLSHAFPFRDEMFWVEEQLRWLHLSHINAQWISTSAHCIAVKSLCELLSQYCKQDIYFRDTDKDDFINAVYTQALKITGQKTLSRYKGKISRQKMNELFMYCNVPYRIIADRKKFKGQPYQWHWKVISCPLEES